MEINHYLSSPSSSDLTLSTTTPFLLETNSKKKRTKFLRIGNPPPKPKPVRKPDPSAPKITRPCTECGKKFWSWKALFGHMRCHPDRQWRGINPPPNLRRSDDDYEVAAALLMLADSPPPPPPGCVDLAGFECSSCKKVFGSHQALGGHRASHKNVKGCYAITRTGEEFEEEAGCSDMMMIMNGHKCSICFRVFSSGQALGGHMRCHWDVKEPSTRVSTGGFIDLNLMAIQDGDHDDDASSSSPNLDLRLGL